MRKTNTLTVLFCVFVTGVNSITLQTQTTLQNSIKCCANNRQLNDKLECIENKNSTFKLYDSNFKTEFNCGKEQNCIDQVNNTLSIVDCNKKYKQNITVQPSFHKCCPVGYAYNLAQHQCLSGNSSLVKFGVGVNFLRVGLQNCEFAIEDYVTSDNAIKLLGDGSISFQGKTYTFEDYCLDDEFARKGLILRICHDNFDVCKSKNCVRKCCEDGELYGPENKCFASLASTFSIKNLSHIESPNDDFALIHGTKCASRNLDNNYTYHLDKMGNLYWTKKGVEYMYTPEDGQYCIEKIEKGSMNGYYFFFCGIQPNQDNTKFILSKVLLILSSIFLVATIAVYIILRDNMNLHKRTMLSYCSCLLSTYVLLLIVQFNPVLEDIPCKIFGFLIEFAFLATLAWLNVMCFDIWWTFGSLRAPGAYQKAKERKKYIYYSLYAWLLPIFWSTLTIVFHFTKALPNALTPQIGNHKCLLEKDHSSYLVYRLLPMAVIVICNTILFGRTSYYCVKVKNEISKMMDSTEKKKAFNYDKDKLMMLLKFLIIMGVSFLCEVLYVTVVLSDNSVLEVIFFALDIINYLQGVFIFVISVIQKQTLAALQKKFGFQEDNKNSSVRTASSMLMTRISSDHRTSTQTNSPQIKNTA